MRRSSIPLPYLLAAKNFRQLKRLRLIGPNFVRSFSMHKFMGPKFEIWLSFQHKRNGQRTETRKFQVAFAYLFCERKFICSRAFESQDLYYSSHLQDIALEKNPKEKKFFIENYTWKVREISNEKNVQVNAAFVRLLNANGFLRKWYYRGPITLKTVSTDVAIPIFTI